MLMLTLASCVFLLCSSQSFQSGVNFDKYGPAIFCQAKNSFTNKNSYSWSAEAPSFIVSKLINGVTIMNA